VSGRDDALRMIARAHTDWTLEYADSAPYVPGDSAPHPGWEDSSDYSTLALDRSATGAQMTVFARATEDAALLLRRNRNR
jgi:hypothetical protein